METETKRQEQAVRSTRPIKLKRANFNLVDGHRMDEERKLEARHTSGEQINGNNSVVVDAIETKVKMDVEVSPKENIEIKVTEGTTVESNAETLSRLELRHEKEEEVFITDRPMRSQRKSKPIISESTTNKWSDEPVNSSSPLTVLSSALSGLSTGSPVKRELTASPPVKISTPPPPTRASIANLPPANKEARHDYIHIEENIYLGKATGKAMDSMPCECSYDPIHDSLEDACGDDRACINRLTYMECSEEDCPTGPFCMNRRFQKKEWADVDIVLTEKKGFGLRALKDMKENEFVMEYIGEVIPQEEFLKRTKQYEMEGREHFYFMTLENDEKIDATRKGCYARFMNHSCNPNCVTQKWAVNKKMRIGIFTKTRVYAGEELTFDYKFERYGADAQKCYCGEPTCKGSIGGRMKQSELEVLGFDHDIDDEDYDSDGSILSRREAKVKKGPKPKAGRLRTADEVRSFVRRMLDSSNRPKLVSNSLERLQSTDSTEVLRMFLKLHGVRLLKYWLVEYKGDPGICRQALTVLQHLPVPNRNILEDCKLLDTVEKFKESADEEVVELATKLLEQWAGLKTIYRIPKQVYTQEQKEAAARAKLAKEANMSPGGANKRSTTGLDYPGEKRARYESSRDFYENGSSNTESPRFIGKFDPSTPPPAAPRAMLARQYPAQSGIYANGFRPTLPTQPLSSMHTPHSSNIAIPVGPSISAHNPFAASIVHQRPIPPAPPELPPHWKTATCDDGRVYYYNIYNGATQWEPPTPKLSSVEGVSQGRIDAVLEEAEAERTRKEREAKLAIDKERNGAVVGSSSIDPKLEAILKKDMSEVVRKYLTKHERIWAGDKELFKELARKITHHIYEKESQSKHFMAGKVTRVNSTMRSKIEKFMDEQAAKMAEKIRKRRRPISGTYENRIGSSTGSSAQTPISGAGEGSDRRETSVSVDTSPFDTSGIGAEGSSISPSPEVETRQQKMNWMENSGSLGT